MTTTERQPGQPTGAATTLPLRLGRKLLLGEQVLNGDHTPCVRSGLVRVGAMPTGAMAPQARPITLDFLEEGDLCHWICSTAAALCISRT